MEYHIDSIYNDLKRVEKLKKKADELAYINPELAE